MTRGCALVPWAVGRRWSYGRSMATEALPGDVEFVRVTADFDEHTVPAGLRAAHRVADGVWGQVVVRSGSLQLVFEDQPDLPRTVSAGETQVLPPGARHHVELVGPVRFAVEFYRPRSGDTVIT